MTTVQTLTAPSSHDLDRSVDPARTDRRRTRTGYEPPRGSTLLALATSAALVIGGVVLANLDNGPTPSSSEAVSLATSDAVSLELVAEQIGADDVWSSGFTGEGINVALIDTGTASVNGLSAPGKIVAAVDFTTEGADPSTATLDSHGHGTHLAGIIGANSDVAGIAPDAGIVSVKVAGEDGEATPTAVLAGIDWVIQHAEELDIRVLNLALDTGIRADYRTSGLASALERAWDQGIVVVVSTGNEGETGEGLTLPASDPFVIAVGAVDGAGGIADWSSRGNDERSPDVVAPGAHIVSLRAPGSAADREHSDTGYVDELRFKGSGTSQSAAVVAGGVALLRQARPELGPDAIKALLTETALDVGPSSAAGHGLIQLDGALAHAATTEAQRWDRAIGTSGDSWTAQVPPTWAGNTWAGNTWAGNTWAGNTWAGNTWAGNTWAGNTWAGNTWAGNTWAGNTWAGNTWAGNTWAGNTWAGNTWAGNTWAGNTWAGNTWAGNTWAGNTWAGNTWAGNTWAGNTWAGNTWAGNTWAGNTWAGNTWAGNTWAGNTWAGNTWAGNTWA